MLDALLSAGLVAGRAQLIEARVPIIKACLAVGACPRNKETLHLWHIFPLKDV